MTRVSHSPKVRVSFAVAQTIRMVSSSLRKLAVTCTAYPEFLEEWQWPS
jgi:hypothetical protein